jgi:hypothetical protein
MKKRILFLFASTFMFIYSHGQIGPIMFTDTITFETPHSSNLRIDTSQSGSIWKIGVPAKTYFNSSYTFPNAIFTDTGYYPNNNYSYFDLIIKNNPWGWIGWGEGILGFWHKYDTDTLMDGGFINVSYDGGNIWKNIIEDSIAMYTGPTDFYMGSDTITGGIPAFNGHSNGWVFSQVYWLWELGVKNGPQDSLILRFVFKSDSIDNNKEGWLIDQIFFNAYSISAVNDIFNDNQIKIIPNPVKDIFYIEVPVSQSDYTFELFDNIGKRILEKKNIRTKKFSVDISNFDKGMYFYKLFSSEKLFTGKILKE